jgi:hypothetical protein
LARVVRAQLDALGQTQYWLAQQMELPASSLSALLNCKRECRLKEVDQLARLLKISFLDLARLFGITAPTPPRSIPVSGLIGDGGLVSLPEAPRTVSVPAGVEVAAAYVVDTLAVQPRYKRGEILFTVPLADLSDAAGRECIVEPTDGRRLLCLVQPGSAATRFALIGLDGRVEIDVELVAAEVVCWHSPIPAQTSA